MAGNHTTHGHTVGGNSPTFNTWAGMMQRCYYAKHQKFADYGGAGIEVDPRWHTFANFLADMGDRPEDHSIERLDSRRNYWLGNCIWLPTHLQQKNRSNSNLITWRLQTMCLADWSKELGIKYSTLRQRIVVLKWPVEKAFTQPLRT